MGKAQVIDIEKPIESVNQLQKVVNKMGPKRKADLLQCLINEIFDKFYDEDDFRIESMIEVIENITGTENLDNLRF